eukprot:GEMP01055081.1.p1 GENE.GEMP01055081.1~~GEMP01055081.1.p1  ORF type:complete len:194 (+),score=32.21 GEMP01055081.1:509-1090(+)
MMYRIMALVDESPMGTKTKPKFLNASSSAEGQIAGSQLYRYALQELDLRGKNAVDVGCYRGGGCEILADKGAEVVGVDMINHGGGERWKFVAEDGLHFLDRSEEQFDVVIMIQSVRDLTNSRRPLSMVLEKVHKALRSGGVCVICEWTTDFSLATLGATAIEAGFEVEVAEDLPVPSGLSRWFSYVHLRIRKP